MYFQSAGKFPESVHYIAKPSKKDAAVPQLDRLPAEQGELPLCSLPTVLSLNCHQ